MSNSKGLARASNSPFNDMMCDERYITGENLLIYLTLRRNIGDVAVIFISVHCLVCIVIYVLITVKYADINMFHNVAHLHLYSQDFFF